MACLTKIQGLAIVIEITTSRTQGCNLSLGCNLKEVCVLWISILQVSKWMPAYHVPEDLFNIYLQYLKYCNCDDLKLGERSQQKRRFLIYLRTKIKWTTKVFLNAGSISLQPSYRLAPFSCISLSTYQQITLKENCFYFIVVLTWK